MWHNTMNRKLQLAQIKRRGVSLYKIREKRWYVVKHDGAYNPPSIDSGPFRTQREAIAYANTLQG